MAYSTISKPSLHFNTKLYTGNGSTQSITGVGFQPDWVWLKKRNSTADHGLYDAVRGVTKQLYSNDTAAEATNANSLTAFGTDGFSIGTSSMINGNSDTFASWNWKAGGSASSNSNGSITSSVSASTDAGFSIVAFTGNGTSGATVGHGLSFAPKVIILKDRDTGINSWVVGHNSLGWTKYLYLNKTDAIGTTSGFWNDTAPTSSVFTLGNNDTVNGSGGLNIAYCFAEKKGYSKFGSYTGNGNADGTFIYTGFKPAFLMTKRTDTTSEWVIFDNKRDSFNQVQKFLQPNSTSAEGNDNGTSSGKQIDFLSNGWKMRGTTGGMNASGGTYIYMAFGQSIVGSNNVPAVAR